MINEQLLERLNYSIIDYNEYEQGQIVSEGTDRDQIRAFEIYQPSPK